MMFAPPIRALIVLALLAFASTSRADDLAESLRLLRGLESRSVVFETWETPLEEVAEELERAIGVPLRIDWEALRRLGVTPDLEISLRQRGGTAAALLSTLCLTLGDEWERPVVDAGGGQVILTTQAATAELRRSDVYDLRPLREIVSAEAAVQGPRGLSPPPATTSAPVGATGLEATPTQDAPPEPVPGAAPDESSQPSSTGSSKLGEDDSTAAAADSTHRALMDLLVDHVDPEAWTMLGGNRAAIGERGGMLVLTASPRIHLQVRTLLDRIASLRPESVELDVLVVAIPRQVLELITRRHEPGRFALLDAVRQAPGVDRLWRAVGVVRLGETFEIITVDRGGDAEREVGGEVGRDGQGEGERGRFQATPTARLAEGRLDVTLEILVESGTRRAEARTTASMPIREGAVVLDLGGDDTTAYVALIAARVF